MRWSRAALADVTTRPIAGNVFGWPGLHAVRVVSRFDYAADVGAYPAGSLREAVAEFHAIVFGDESVGSAIMASEPEHGERDEGAVTERLGRTFRVRADTRFDGRVRPRVERGEH